MNDESYGFCGEANEPWNGASFLGLAQDWFTWWRDERGTIWLRFVED